MRPASGQDAPFTLYNSGAGQFLDVRSTAGVYSFDAFNTSSNRTITAIGQVTGHERVQLVIRITATTAAFSINGEPMARVTYHLNGVAFAGFTPANLKMLEASSGRVCLRRLLIVNRAVADEDLDDFHVENRRYVIAAHPVSFYKEHSGALNCREPSIVVLDDGGSSGVATWIVFYTERSSASPNGESAARLGYRHFHYDRAANRLWSPQSSGLVFAQPSAWATGSGHMQSPCAYLRRSGAHAGRLYALWSQADGWTTVTGDAQIDLYPRNVWMKYSDDLGLTWNSAAKILDAGAAPGYILAGPNGNAVILASGRVCVPVYTPNGVAIAYTDDDVTWHLGSANTGAPTDRTPVEPTLALSPNGDLWLTSRLTVTSTGVDAQNQRGVFRSVNGGATLTYVETVPNYLGAAVGSSTAQLDAAGKIGTVGRIAHVRALTSSPSTPIRHGSRISFFEDSSFAPVDEFEPLREQRVWGYQDIAPLFGGDLLAWAGEVTLDGAINGRDSVHCGVIRPKRHAHPIA
jgi:hypothetical protein